MITLPPLFVVTGCVKVEGGETRKQHQERQEDGSYRVTGTRNVSDSGRKGHTLATHYMRLLSTIEVLKTPFGHLVTPQSLSKVKVLIGHAAQAVVQFNEGATNGCRLWNCMVWESLDGNRRAAVEGWLSAHADDVGIQKVLEALA